MSLTDMSLTDIILRLGVATLSGGLIGLNRYAHHKSIGIRTLALVALGAAAVVVATADAADASNTSRVIQGLVTSIGFIGAGVIMRDDGAHRVHGLTTATTVWFAALIGVLCGLGVWAPLAVTGVLAAAVLLLGGRLEKRLVRSRDKADRAAGDGGDGDA